MIWIGLGTNLGDRAANIFTAIAALTRHGIQLSRLSQLYITPPWGQTDQPPFLNAVAEISFGGSARELLAICMQIEHELGRVRVSRWGPRVIDLDILEFRGQIIDQPDLKVPHPHYTQRAFVLKPLAELVPEMIPTGQTLTVEALYAILPAEEILPYAPVADHSPTS